MKLNPDYSVFDGNMFVQLRALLADVALPENKPMLDLSIGEPQLPVSSILTDGVQSYNNGWQFYPKANGTPRFRATIGDYIARRWPAAAGLVDVDRAIAPVTGTREPLFMLGNLVQGTKPDPVALVTNPFYHAWRAGGLASGSEIVFMNSDAGHNFLPDLDAISVEIYTRTTIMYLCSPTNPHGYVMDIDYLKKALGLARRYDFLLVLDECYADIWRGSPPTGLLEAAAALVPDSGDDDPLHNMVILNSLSKRSGAAGIRAGFMAGDSSVIELYLKLIGNGGSLVPTPLLEVASDLYADEAHVAKIRAHYDHSFALAEQHLGITAPPGGFFLWLPVEDDIEFVKRLMAEQAVKAIPGSYMGVETAAGNPGRGYVRLALVHEHAVIDQALARIATLYQAK
ncbi:aminotransferase class I/II-fold pyridoxal phosphate-dependent enzyme [Candidatus Puniceispirillum marinum]|uniref:Aminotransferase n=1 Tax=Puniceispirillum marinum (strain IMCC1322) TaxID=488538 RepID=D5BMK7_PUNMI|nr:aminotransferase class I/II-fold pyridoxal phosphate-dependent enzyme [Candidatus Puniceispirillum marinum]ADE40050.1 Aspartate/tyrosine/aromatic aminotransferase [Candidatus Puniceispirillum marinum IMCC1322]